MLLFLVTPCLVLAVQSCVERIPIKKKILTQTFVKLSSIQTFSCGLTLKPGKMFRLRIVWSVFPLKMNMGGSICPSAMADNATVKCFFSFRQERTTHSLSPFFAILMRLCQKTLMHHPCYRQVKRNTFQFS